MMLRSVKPVSVDPVYLSQLLASSQLSEQYRRDRNDWRSASFILFGAVVVLIGAFLW